MKKPNFEINQDGYFTAHLIEIPPNGKCTAEAIIYPPTAEHLQYLTDGWGVEEVPGWTTYEGLPCIA
jgi:hypothetical protein